jgi:hypothetical protein
MEEKREASGAFSMERFLGADKPKIFRKLDCDWIWARGEKDQGMAFLNF